MQFVGMRFAPLTLFLSLALLLLQSKSVISQVVVVGTLPNQQHGIGGTLQILSTTEIRLKGFSYDGGGPAAYLYYFAPGAAVSSGAGTIIPYQDGDSRGAFTPGVRFSNEDISFSLPTGTDVCDIGTFTIWCAAARSFFTRLVFPRTLFVGNGADPCALVAFSTTMAPAVMTTQGPPITGSVAIPTVGPTTNDSSTSGAEGTTSGAEDTTSPPTQTSQIEVGSLPTLGHGVSGTLIFLSTTRVRIQGFSYDGAGPDAYLYYYSPTASVSATGGGTIIPLASDNGGNSRGAFQRGERYTNQEFTFDLPSGTDVCDIGSFTIWCQQARSFFTRLEIRRDLFENNGGDPCTLRGGGAATSSPTSSSQYENCEVLHTALQLRWTVDRSQEKIHFMLSGCQGKNVEVAQYMGFGLSGSTTQTLMDGADVTIAWVGNDGQPNAVDYFLQSRTQCRAGVGVCPDTLDSRGTCSNNVEAVSGKNVIRQQRVSFTRPFRTNDSVCDLDFDVDSDQYIVWAIGGVEQTAFRHNINSAANTPPLQLGRTPVDNCGSTDITCDSCPVFSSTEIKAPVNGTMFVARIGPSGNDRGYTAITKQVGWGIAWYINDSLVPVLVVERNMTYYFEVEGGSNSDDTSNYHPFYITDSSIGGRLLNTPEERQAETVYAGFNANGEPTGVGRLCKSVETANSFLVLERCGDFQEFQETLNSFCSFGQPGKLEWTPDDNTPDIVYYQCATHRNLGWKIMVVDSLTASSLPVTISQFLLAALSVLAVLVNILS